MQITVKKSGGFDPRPFLIQPPKPRLRVRRPRPEYIKGILVFDTQNEKISVDAEAERKRGRPYSTVEDVFVAYSIHITNSLDERKASLNLIGRTNEQRNERRKLITRLRNEELEKLFCFVKSKGMDAKNFCLILTHPKRPEPCKIHYLSAKEGAKSNNRGLTYDEVEKRMTAIEKKLGLATNRFEVVEAIYEDQLAARKIGKMAPVKFKIIEKKNNAVPIVENSNPGEIWPISDTGIKEPIELFKEAESKLQKCNKKKIEQNDAFNLNGEKEEIQSFSDLSPYFDEKNIILKMQAHMTFEQKLNFFLKSFPIFPPPNISTIKKKAERITKNINHFNEICNVDEDCVLIDYKEDMDTKKRVNASSETNLEKDSTRSCFNHK